jgi:hypothetical protein
VWYKDRREGLIRVKGGPDYSKESLKKIEQLERKDEKHLLISTRTGIRAASSVGRPGSTKCSSELLFNPGCEHVSRLENHEISAKMCEK